MALHALQSYKDVTQVTKKGNFPYIYKGNLAINETRSYTWSNANKRYTLQMCNTFRSYVTCNGCNGIIFGK